MKNSTAFIIGLTAAVVMAKSCCVISEALGDSRSLPLSSISTPINASSYEYKLSGTSDLTEERVLAYLNPIPSKEGYLEGILLEKTYIYHITAVWNGKGTVIAKSIISTYHLKVVD